MTRPAVSPVMAAQPLPERLFAFTTRGSQPIGGVCFQPGDWLVFGADLFLTVAVEVAFALLMTRTLYVVEREGWLLAALRISWKPVLGALVTAVALGLLADWLFPQADTLAQVLRSL